MKYINTKNILHPNQYGFCKEHSTKYAFLHIINHIQININNNNKCAAIFLDLRKAFDTIHYDLLLNKLFNYGIAGDNLKLIKTYLSYRSAITTINGVSSPELSIDLSVPQESLLGPLLFSLYIK